MDYIVFPSMKPTWQTVAAHLEDLRTFSQEPNCDLRELAKRHQEIVNVNQGKESDLIDYGNSTLYGLVKYLKKYASDEERRLFLQSTFPAIISLAIQLPQVLPAGNVPRSRQQEASTTRLSRRCIASIMACSFLCLFEDIRRPWMTDGKMNVANFTSFFKNLPLPSQNAKIKCILDYFEQVAERWDDLHGNVTFIRQVIPREEIPTLDIWLNCDSELCPLVVHDTGVIEDAGCEAVEVDFANKFIGGGVLGKGRVQEEIRFTVCPELLASLIFMERMEENEAIIIKGYEQFTSTVGYAASLEYAGRHSSNYKVDENGDLITTLCAIDAVSYRSKPEKQYSDHMYLRDLNKAYVGFSARCLRGASPPRNDQFSEDLGTHTDDNFSSLTDEEYLTASDEEANHTDPVLKFIRNLAEGLVVDIMPSALLEASSVLLKSDTDQPTSKIQVEMCETPMVEQDVSHEEVQAEDGMAHLDVADWVMRNHRRSSNLSDVGSRRSSTSTKHSSEFSSEFEEYFENFLKRDQPVIHKTIKEEIFPEISEFASTLAARLLQEGTFTAVHVKPDIQKFHSEAPDEVKLRPKARKTSDEIAHDEDCVSIMSEEEHSSSESENNTILDSNVVCRTEPCDVSEVVARKFADSFIRNLMPFPETNSFVNSSKHFCDESGDTYLADSPQTEVRGDVSDIDIAVGDSKLGESASTSSDSMPGYWFLRKGSSGSVDADLNKSNIIGPSPSKSSQEKPKPPVTRKMKQIATDFVADVVIGAIQKYSQEVEQETYIPENVLRLQSREFYFNNDFDEDDNAEDNTNENNKSASDVSISPLQTEAESKHYSLVSGKFSPNASSSPDMCVLADNASLQAVNSITDLDDIDKDDADINKCQATNYKLSSMTSEEFIESNKNKLEKHSLPEEQKAIPKVMVTDDSEGKKDILYGNMVDKIVQDECSNTMGGLRKNVGSGLQAEKPLKTKPDVILKKSRTHSKTKSHSDYDNTHSKYNLQNLPLGTSASKFSDSHHNKDQSFEEKEPRKVTFFASSLSRDLLTNAFVEVQRNMNGGNIYRRSSEPLKISNHESQSLRERSVNGTNRKLERSRFQSLTDEDVGRFAQELTRWGSLEDFRNKLRRGSCGFRDPTLSRFAEQLMRSNCSVPDLYLLGSTNMSTSGDSSASRRSSMSGFKDSTLASFEEELLISPHGRNSLRGAKLKSAKKAAKLVRQKSVVVKDISLDVRDSTSSRSLLGKSFDSETSGVSWTSFQSSSPSQSFDEMSSYAERLAQSVVQESFETLLRGALQELVTPGTTCPAIHKSDQHVTQQFGDFANNMANDVVMQALMSLANCYATSSKQKKRSSDATSLSQSDTSKVRSASETESLELYTSSSEEYTDALDVPFSRLEMYAGEVAAKVLQHSVNIFEREMDSERKRRLGRPISTGNWGCGAFRGDPTLKTMLQWMAASYAGTPFILYYTFQNPELEQLQDVVNMITAKRWNVGHLMQAVRRYCTTVCELEDPSQSPDLFHLLLSEDTFADIE